MKTKLPYLIIFLIILTGCFGSLKKPDTVDKDYLNKQKQSEKAKLEITAAEKKIEDKGRAFLHAAEYTLNQETNKTPHVLVTGTFLNYATLSLGKPSINDAKIVEEISDGLISGYKAENIKLRLESSTNKVEIDILKTQLKAAESEAKAANLKLDKFTQDVVRLQNNEELLKKKYQNELDKLNEENLANAAKAAAWDEDNSFLNSINPLHDLAKFFKKLFTLTVIAGILFIGFKVLEVFFPALSILSGIGGMCIGVVKKILPGAIKSAGLVGKGVYDALAHVVKSNQEFLSKLEQLPLEDELIEKYPDNYNFTKKEVKELLLSLTDKTVEELKKELQKNTDEQSRGIISYVKADKGIKEEKPVMSLI